MNYKLGLFELILILPKLSKLDSFVLVSKIILFSVKLSYFVNYGSIVILGKRILYAFITFSSFVSCLAPPKCSCVILSFITLEKKNNNLKTAGHLKLYNISLYNNFLLIFTI